MLCIRALERREDGVRAPFRGSCGDSAALRLSCFNLSFLIVNRKKINICKLRIQQLSVQYCIFVIPLYICYLNTELFICDALHLGAGVG